MKFASKRELLIAMEQEHARLMALIASIPAARRREPGVWGDGWTVDDLIAHLMEWQLMVLRWHREGRAGGTPEMPAPGYKWNETPALNRAIRRKHHRASARSIAEEFERSYEEIRRSLPGCRRGRSSRPPAALAQGRLHRPVRDQRHDEDVECRTPAPRGGGSEFLGVNSSRR